jgi:hypothetical protein
MKDILNQIIFFIIGIPLSLIMTYIICRIASFAFFKSLSDVFGKNCLTPKGEK